MCNKHLLPPRVNSCDYFVPVVLCSFLRPDFMAPVPRPISLPSWGSTSSVVGLHLPFVLSHIPVCVSINHVYVALGGF